MRIRVIISDSDSTVLDQFEIVTEAELMGEPEPDAKPHILAGKVRELIERKFSTEDAL